VFGLVGGGGQAQLVLAEERHVVRVPDSLDHRAAAAAPQSFLTAFDALVVQGRVRGGDVVLVNGASGGVGFAAVQIAAAMRARVVGSVRSDQLRPRVAPLGAEALAPDDAFDRVRELGGADVILELVGAPHMQRNMDVLAQCGRIVLVAGKVGEEVAVVLRDLMSRRASLIGTTLRTRPAEEKAALIQDFRRRVVPLLGDGTLTAPVGDVFPLDTAADAYDHVRTPGRFGKTLLELPPR
jgi:NADPH:quinone reductase-like Zn-dependent oxidoreductase